MLTAKDIQTVRNHAGLNQYRNAILAYIYDANYLGKEITPRRIVLNLDYLFGSDEMEVYDDPFAKARLRQDGFEIIVSYNDGRLYAKAAIVDDDQPVQVIHLL